jgi:hypothetical protein
MPGTLESQRPSAAVWRSWSIVPLLVLAAAILLLFPARVMECDAVIYASRARSGDIEALCNPGHLLHGCLEHAALLAGQQAHPPLNAIFLLQYVSMTAALLGLYFFHRALIEADVSRSRALFFTTVLFLSYGYWHYSTQGEPCVLAAAALAAFLWRFTRFLRRPSVREGVIAGAMLALATLMHQTCILVLPAALVGLLIPRGRQHRPGHVLAFIAAAIGATVLPYLVLGWTILGLRDPGEFRSWVMGLSKWGVWGGWSAASPVRAAVGVTRSLVGSHFFLGIGTVESFARGLFPRASWADEMAIAGYAPGWVIAALAAAEIWILGVAVVAIARAARVLKRSFVSDGGLTPFLVAWIAIVGVFFTWWCPERAEFWIPVFPPLLMLLARSSEARSRGGAGPRRVAVALVAMLFLVNFWGSIYPQSLERMEPDTLAALAIESAIEPGSVLLTDGSLRGRASKFARAFEKVNLTKLDTRGVPGGETVSKSDLRARAVRLAALLLKEADSKGRSVYLLAEPLSLDGDAASRYEWMVEAIADSFDVTERLAVRAPADLRKVKPAENAFDGSRHPRMSVGH